MRLHALTTQRFDLLVVGGGINGAGIAGEAARRGWRVALVEKQDYAAGTTSRSTRLIHGGLRYLEHGEVMLVLESLRERKHLLHSKPHLVRPLQFLIPVFRDSSRSPLTIRAGMLLYDLLAAGRAVPRHRALHGAALRELEARLAAPNLRGAFLYYDGQVNFPERLVAETMAAARACGAVTVNHCELLDFLWDGRRVIGARLRDTLAGDESTVAAAVTVNVTGPWLPRLDALLPAHREHSLLAPTRGSHIAVAPFPGAPGHDSALYFEAASDARPVFVVPWNSLMLIGTTDLPFEGDPSAIRPLESEVDYLLNEVNRMLPAARLTRASVLYSYAGVRALPFEEAVAPGDLTRRHIYFDHQTRDGIAGLVTVLGGKLTTYRSLARDVIDKVARKLGVLAAREAAQPAPPADFVFWPWNNGRAELERLAAPLAAQFEMAPEAVVRLFELYGGAAREVLKIAREAEALRRTLVPGSPVIGAEIVHAARNEQALTLGDVLLRRTCAALDGRRGAALAEPVARLMACELAWTDSQASSAMDDYLAEVDQVLVKV